MASIEKVKILVVGDSVKIIRVQPLLEATVCVWGDSTDYWWTVAKLLANRVIQIHEMKECGMYHMYFRSGDNWPGVGKSSLVHLICHSEAIQNSSWTIGCSVEVKLHEYKEGTPFQKTYFVELWDVGGSCSHRNSRVVFYNSFHGIILVHDLTNRKSKQNLRKWLAEVLSKDSSLGKKNNGWYSYDSEQFVDSQIPILVIGTKHDLVLEVYPPTRTKRSSSISEECGADEIYVDCTQVRSFAPGSSNAVKLSRYFDKVIERKHQSLGGSHISSILDRRRIATQAAKQSHID